MLFGAQPSAPVARKSAPFRGPALHLHDVRHGMDGPAVLLVQSNSLATT